MKGVVLSASAVSTPRCGCNVVEARTLHVPCYLALEGSQHLISVIGSGTVIVPPCVAAKRNPNTSFGSGKGCGKAGLAGMPDDL